MHSKLMSAKNASQPHHYEEGSQINPYAEENKVIESMPGSFFQSELQNDDEADKVFRRSAINSVPRPIPLITAQYSLKPDMIFGWKPDVSNMLGAPIPLHFDYETFDNYVPVNPATNEEYPVTYYGPRFKDSLEMHKAFANQNFKDGMSSYKFKFPNNMKLFEACSVKKPKQDDEERPFTGMNPLIASNEFNSINPEIFKKPSLIFDSHFECGNLDMVVQIREDEYDLYMRVDSNTRGHHQWFFFNVSNSVKGKVKFNIVNFTKNASLYHQGMRINVMSTKENEAKLAKILLQGNQGGQQPNSANGEEQLLPNEGWVKGCENIVYKLSKISQPRMIPGVGYQYPSCRRYFQVSFEYDFQHPNDTVSFAYSVPYTFTKLQSFLKHIMKTHQETVPNQNSQFVRESTLCKSLSGLEVPVLTVSSRIHSRKFEVIDETEFNSPEQLPLNKFKKYIIVCSRVHPGETNASYIMQGFIKFITSPTNPEAIELRKRIVFKIIPMTNPDGVIVGNYRSSMSGNDLNRQFISPNIKLHPTVCAIKQLVSEIINNAKEPEPLSSFIDIHGHSRKKSIFIYGPHFPLHNERYLKMRVLPQLLSERTDMFRFYSCKFRIQKSKLKAARVVLWKEFNIMNCFTLEASFHGYIDKDRQTIELTTEMLQNMGAILGSGFHEYQTLVEEDEKQRLLIKQQMKNKKKQPKTGSKKGGETQQMVKSDGNQEAAEESPIGVAKSNDIQQQQQSKHRRGQPLKIVSESGLTLSEEVAPDCNTSVAVVDTSYYSKTDDLTPLSNRGGDDREIGIPDVQVAPAGNLGESSTSKIRQLANLNGSNKKGFRIKKSSGKQLPGGGVSSQQQPQQPLRQRNGGVGFGNIQPILSTKALETQNGNNSASVGQNTRQKRTLKEIYKIFQRDAMILQEEQDDGRNNVQSNDERRSSDSEDSALSNQDEEEDDDDSCCEGGGGRDVPGGGVAVGNNDDYDELSPAELADLQRDIISAIERFDAMYNKNPQRGQKGAKITDQLKQYPLPSNVQEIASRKGYEEAKKQKAGAQYDQQKGGKMPPGKIVTAKRQSASSHTANDTSNNSFILTRGVLQNKRLGSGVQQAGASGAAPTRSLAEQSSYQRFMMLQQHVQQSLPSSGLIAGTTNNGIYPQQYMMVPLSQGHAGLSIAGIVYPGAVPLQKQQFISHVDEQQPLATSAGSQLSKKKTTSSNIRNLLRLKTESLQQHQLARGQDRVVRPVTSSSTVAGALQHLEDAAEGLISYQHGKPITDEDNLELTPTKPTDYSNFMRLISQQINMKGNGGGGDHQYSQHQVDQEEENNELTNFTQQQQQMKSCRQQPDDQLRYLNHQGWQPNTQGTHLMLIRTPPTKQKIFQQQHSSQFESSGLPTQITQAGIASNSKQGGQSTPYRGQSSNYQFGSHKLKGGMQSSLTEEPSFHNIGAPTFQQIPNQSVIIQNIIVNGHNNNVVLNNHSQNQPYAQDHTSVDSRLRMMFNDIQLRHFEETNKNNVEQNHAGKDMRSTSSKQTRKNNGGAHGTIKQVLNQKLMSQFIDQKQAQQQFPSPYLEQQMPITPHSLLAKYHQQQQNIPSRQRAFSSLGSSVEIQPAVPVSSNIQPKQLRSEVKQPLHQRRGSIDSTTDDKATTLVINQRKLQSTAGTRAKIDDSIQLRQGGANSGGTKTSTIANTSMAAPLIFLSRDIDLLAGEKQRQLGCSSFVLQGINGELVSNPPPVINNMLPAKKPLRKYHNLMR